MVFVAGATPCPVSNLHQGALLTCLAAFARYKTVQVLPDGSKIQNCSGVSSEISATFGYTRLAPVPLVPFWPDCTGPGSGVQDPPQQSWICRPSGTTCTVLKSNT